MVLVTHILMPLLFFALALGAMQGVAGLMVGGLAT